MNRKTAAFGIPLTALALSFAAIYWMKSLEYHWFSTMYGVWFFANCMRAGMAFGLKAFHWYLFAQPFDLPERMLRADPAYYLDWSLRNAVLKFDAVTSETLAEYHRAFAKESVRHAMVEDYRAAASIDLQHDREDLAAGRRIACPLQVLWCASNTATPDPLEIWRTWADQVEGGTIDSGHLMAEEAPGEVLAQLLPFLQRHA